MSVEKHLVEVFEILDNGDEMGISFQLDDGPVSSADFVYDGGNCAILIRNNTKAFLFINIVKDLRQKIMNINELMIIEEKGEDILNSYMVNVRKVEKIPFEDTLTEDLIALMTDLKEVYGEDGVARISKELWNV